jgi:hypothetical protein
MHPECSTRVLAKNGQVRTVEGCAANEYCSTNCTCLGVDAPTPDLMIDVKTAVPILVNEYYVEPTSCALSEGCLTGHGNRRIVKFNTDIFNQGTTTFAPPNPPTERPDLYEWASCHGHFHIAALSEFYLIDPKTGKKLVRGLKRSYCAVDHAIIEPGPNAPCTAQSTCAEQGISRGWVDVYSSELDCQFLDVTDVPSGHYIIRQCVNPERKFYETSMENNCIDTPYFLPPKPKATNPPGKKSG